MVETRDKLGRKKNQTERQKTPEKSNITHISIDTWLSVVVLMAHNTLAPFNTNYKLRETKLTGAFFPDSTKHITKINSWWPDQIVTEFSFFKFVFFL